MYTWIWSSTKSNIYGFNYMFNPKTWSSNELPYSISLSLTMRWAWIFNNFGFRYVLSLNTYGSDEASNPTFLESSMHWA